MKVLVINLPHKRKIIRKYSCSYYANGFMYPCIELLRCATLLKQSDQFAQVNYTDAIAQKKDEASCLLSIRELKPDVIITLLSVDFINDEIRFLKSVRQQTSSCIVGIGYLPAQMRNTMQSVFDIILGNNFEQAIKASLLAMKTDASKMFDSLLKENSRTNEPFDADAVSVIDYSFVNHNLYSEFHAHGKTGFIYLSFGCSFRCAFCIRTYNLSASYARSSANIMTELKLLHAAGVKNIRILDDNCTGNIKLLETIASELEKSNLHFNFYGLTRFDLINDKTITLLNKMGFRRLYLGLESVEQERQTGYMKNINVTDGSIERKINLLHKSSIECALFFMFDPVKENKSDIRKILSFLKGKPVAYANLSFLVPYPGTPIFDMYREHIDYEESPEYKSVFRNVTPSQVHRIALQFLLSFYLMSFRHFLFAVSRLFVYPRQTIEVAVSILKYIFRPSAQSRDDFF